MEIVRSALQELNEERNGKDDGGEEEEEQKVTAPPSPSRGGQEEAAKKSSSGDKANTSPTSGRRSRIIEREERLRQIDLEREKIKRRRMERQSRRRESDLGSVARAKPDNAADTSASTSTSTSTTSTTDQLSSELRQSAPVSIGERRRNRVTTPPSSPRREVLADITTTTRPPSPPSATSTSTTASPRRKKGSPIVPRLDIAKTREAAAKAPGPNSPTSPSLLRNSSRVPPAASGAVATAADLRRQLRERSSRRVVTVPQPSTLSLSIRERLQHDALHRARTTAAASRQPSPSPAPTPKPTPTAATAAQDKAQPRRRREPSPMVVKKPATAAKEKEKKQKEDEKKKPVIADAGGGGGGDASVAAAAAGCETVLAYSSLKERKIVDAFLEVIAKEKREREEREQAEKKGRGCVLPYPIPAPGSPSSSFIIMPSPPKRKSLSPGDEAMPASASTSTTSSSGSPPKKRKLENGESASSVDDSSSSKENVASALNSPHGKPTLQRCTRPISSLVVCRVACRAVLCRVMSCRAIVSHLQVLCFAATSKETWRGEGEGTLRARQHKEREDVHRLYGLDAELARKSEEKLKPDTVREAIVWVYKAARGNTKGSVLMPSSSRGTLRLTRGVPIHLTFSIFSFVCVSCRVCRVSC
jgi:hypothetical protein